MTLPYSGKTSSYHHKCYTTPNPENVSPGLKKVWFLDAQWSTCPIEVYNEVRELWKQYDLGNDHYMLKLAVEDMEPEELPYLIQYIREHNIPDYEQVVIHWWW